MNQHCIDKINKEIVPILASFPDRYKNVHLKENFHLLCYYHCVNCLPKNKHNAFINKCIECVKSKKDYYCELEAYKTLRREYDAKGYTYYYTGKFVEEFKKIAKKYSIQNKKSSCPITKKTRQMKELTKYLVENNLKMNEHLMKLDTGIVVQLTRRQLAIQKFMGDCLDEFIDEQIEDDILRVASQLV